MSKDIMLALGDFRFAISTAAYQTLKRTTEHRWSAQNRIGRAPALQFAGIGTDEITLTGVIYPHFKGGLNQIKTMRDTASTGKPQLLVDGLGFVHGDYAITRIEETQTHFIKNGIPKKQEFTLSLQYYGEDNAV